MTQLLLCLLFICLWCCHNGFVTQDQRILRIRNSLRREGKITLYSKKNSRSNKLSPPSPKRERSNTQTVESTEQIANKVDATLSTAAVVPTAQISNAVLEKMKEDKAKNPTLDTIALQKALTEYAEASSTKPITVKKGFGSSTTQAKISKEEWFEEYEKLKKEQDLSPAKEKKKDSEGAFGERVLERFPPAQLKMIDNMLVGATFASLSVVIAIGVGLSLSSLKIPNSDFQIDPVWIDFINNSLYPAFTPAIGVLFLCSITFGIFKFAQVSSNKTLYTEE